MKLATILLSLIIGGSSVAVAQPHRSYDRRGDTYSNRYTNTQWVTLSGSVPTTENRHFIKVTPGAGRFDKVRLSIDSGRVLVRQIVVNFADNTSQKLRVDRWMRAGQVTDIDLPGRFRAVNRIIVYTDRGYFYGPGPRGTYSVLASRATGNPQWGYGRDWNDRYDYDHDRSSDEGRTYTR
jgi:hypothetical protein